MRFTDSPYELMMQQRPRYTPAPRPRKPPKGSPCRGCSYWNGAACVGTCYRELIITGREAGETSGQVGPKSGGVE